MKNYLISIYSNRFLAFIVCCLAIFITPAAHAQFEGGFGTLETVFGPLLPPGGIISSSFRSEVGGGFGVASFGKATFQSNQQELDNFDSNLLNRRHHAFDESPFELKVFGKLRLWRFAYNISYTYLQSRSKHLNRGVLDLSAFRMGMDFDVVQHNWMTAGPVVDFCLTEPYFEGRLVRADQAFSPNELYYREVYGKKPSMIGAYLRYMPPEILNFPLHIEAFYKVPLTGSKMTSYGGSLVFRPQIYRFDAALKISIDNNYLKFSNDSAAISTGNYGSNTEIEADWISYAMDIAIYF